MIVNLSSAPYLTDFHNYACVRCEDTLLGFVPAYTRPLKGIVNARYGLLITETLLPDIQRPDTVSVDELSLPVSVTEAEWMVAHIGAAFGLNTKEEAEILKVTRQTIYSWIRGENTPNAESSYRLRLITQLADKWNQLSSWVLGKYLHVSIDGETLFAKLCQHNPDIEDIEVLLGIISKLVKYDNDKQRHIPSEVKNSECDFITSNAFIPSGCR
jgi:hypothetical protein